MMVNGEYFFSCDYPDLCLFIKNTFPESFEPSYCLTNYPWLAEYGIDCYCPFNLAEGFVDLGNINFDINISSALVFLSTGDFDVSANVTDKIGDVANIQFKFSLKRT